MHLICLKKIEPKNSKQVERSIILKARILVASGQIDQAIDVLRKDHEAYLDHVEVIFELGMLYAQFDANLWPGRKTLSIFISRCKRMTPVELKTLNLDEKLVRAQTQLDLIDKKLGV